MIYLNLVNELICALCWGITIRLILIRHLNSETKVARFNTFAFVLMVVNLVVVLPIFAFLLKNLSIQSVSWLSSLVVATIDALSTFNLILYFQLLYPPAKMSYYCSGLSGFRGSC